MRISLRRVTAPLVFAILAGSIAAPAHADPTWVQTGRGEVAIATPGGPTDLVLALLRGTGGKACAPRKTSLTVYNLQWTTWLNPESQEIAYRWEGPGSATASDDCAGRVNVSVQVSDYAPAGVPPVVRGNAATGTSTASSGGLLTASATSVAWVTYYNPRALYQRGDSLVEIKVSGSYYNKDARATVPIGCVATYTHVTPTPLGPQFAPTTEPQPCS